VENSIGRSGYKLAWCQQSDISLDTAKNRPGNSPCGYINFEEYANKKRTSDQTKPKTTSQHKNQQEDAHQFHGPFQSCVSTKSDCIVEN
jgi:hypothetical protein